jgi:hypothetical protein
MMDRARALPSRVGLACVLVFALTAGCVHFVADYDDQIDQGISDVLRQFQSVFTRMERTAGSEAALYPNFVRDYDDIRTKLRVLSARARAHVKNDLTVQMIDLLLDSLGKLEELHRMGPIPIEQQAVVRRGIETSCTAILKLELAKKRGDAGS